MMTMTMMMICIVWLLRPTTLPKSAVLVGGVGGVGGLWGVARAAWPALLCSGPTQGATRQPVLAATPYAL